MMDWTFDPKTNRFTDGGTFTPPELVRTCHDCGYKRYFKDTRHDGPIFVCWPAPFFFSDSAGCVKKDCEHWVPVGQEVEGLPYGTFKMHDEVDEDEEEDMETAVQCNRQSRLDGFGGIES